MIGKGPYPSPQPQCQSIAHHGFQVHFLQARLRFDEGSYYSEDRGLLRFALACSLFLSWLFRGSIVQGMRTFFMRTLGTHQIITNKKI